MTKNKNKKSSEAAKQEAFKLSDGICYCKTPDMLLQNSGNFLACERNVKNLLTSVNLCDNIGKCFNVGMCAHSL